MPVDGALNGPGLIAEVTNTWSSQPTGDDQPRPFTSACQAMLAVVDHAVGSGALSSTPSPAGPRNCGQAMPGDPPRVECRKRAHQRATTARVRFLMPSKLAQGPAPGAIV